LPVIHGLVSQEQTAVERNFCVKVAYITFLSKYYDQIFYSFVNC